MADGGVLCLPAANINEQIQESPIVKYFTEPFKTCIVLWNFNKIRGIQGWKEL